MQNRIDRLEGLVLSLMTNGPNAAGPTAAQAALSGSISGSSAENPLETTAPESIKEEMGREEESDVEQVAKSIGVMKMDNNKTIFASEAHWYAILGEVRLEFPPNKIRARLTRCRLPRSRTISASTRSSTKSSCDGTRPTTQATLVLA